MSSPAGPRCDKHVVALDPRSARHLISVTFAGVPGTANAKRSPTTKAWLETLHKQARGVANWHEPGMRYWARVDFRLYDALNPKQEWDVDNLLKALLDPLAEEGWFRPADPRRGSLKRDERVDFVTFRKQTVTNVRDAGCRLELWTVVEH